MTTTRRALLLAAPGLLQAREGEVLRVGSFGATPYVIDQGEAPPKGALVDFCDQELAPRMGLQLAWQPVVTVPRLMRSLQDGTVDFCPMLTRTPEREALVRFAAASHWQFESVIALRPDHELAQRSRLQPSDLDGLRVGWIQGSPLPPQLERRRVRWDLTSVLGWERSILVKVERGQIDAGYFSNSATPAWHARASGARLVLIPIEVPARPLYAAFSLQQPVALLARYEAAARQAFTPGRFEGYLRRWQEQAE